MPPSSRLALLLALAAAAIVPAHAALPPGISGTWYNPAQSGHGFSLEILDAGRALGFWYVYDADGNPVHLYLDGVIDGRRIEADAWLSRGMRFGSFDPQQHSLRRWGEVTLAFDDCDTAQLSWNASGEAGAGYGSGTMPLQRLSRIASLPCALVDESADLPAGLYQAGWDRPSGGEVERPLLFQAAVDREGRLWAAATWAAGPTFLRSFLAPPVLMSAPAQRVGSQAQAQLEIRYARALGSPRTPSGQLSLPLVFDFDAAGNSVATLATQADPALLTQAHFSRAAAATDPLQRGDFDASDLAGRRFGAETSGQFVRPVVHVRFGVDGSICIDTFVTCHLSGRLGAFEPGLAMFAFELQDVEQPSLVYSGKGWLRVDTGELVLVGAAGAIGLGFVATER